MTAVEELQPGSGPGHVGVVVSEFNRSITDKLLDGAIAMLTDLGVPKVTVLRVPGALELAVAAGRMLDAGCDGVVAIGAVIRGETDHYEIVSRVSASMLAEIAIRKGKPIGNAVLAVDHYEHAEARARSGPDNKGAEAALAVVDTVKGLNGLQSPAE